jgi:hypothetical protein
VRQAAKHFVSWLVVENNYARWSDMVGSGDHGDKHNSASAPLYTNAGKSKKKWGCKALSGLDKALSRLDSGGIKKI